MARVSGSEVASGTFVDVPTSGTLASRPAVIAKGQSYLATDTNGGTLYVSLDGSTWTQVAAGVSSGGAVASVYGRTGTVVAAAGDYTAEQIGPSGAFDVAENLAEGTPSTMRTNLGLGTAATQAATDFVAYVTGLDTTGATDNTSVLNAAIAAAPAGSTLLLPSGCIKYSALTDPGKEITLQGQGWWTDLASAFGDAGWTGLGAHFAGTILLSTKTTAGASLFGQTNPFNFRDLMVVGPGSGTSTGIQVGDATHSPVRLDWHNVGVANFATCVSWGAQLSKVTGRLTTLGCHNGFVEVGSPTVYNIEGFEVTASDTRGADLSVGTGAKFTAPVFQGNTGDSLYLGGSNGHTFESPHFENASGTHAVNAPSGSDHTFIACGTYQAGDSMSIAAAQVAMVNPISVSADITVTGARFIGIGEFSGHLKGSGITAANGTVALGDTGTAQMLGGGDVRIPSGKKFYFEDTGTNNAIWRDVSSSDTVIGTPSGVVRPDTANGRWFRQASGTTGSRPTPGASDVGSTYFDTTLLRFIGWDGTTWRAGGSKEIYGDGSDGVVNFDGSTTVLGLAPSSGVYTLTRDVFLADGSQISGSAIIDTANFRIFCRGTFTIGASATIRYNGSNGLNATAGAARATGIFGTNPSAGGAGGAGTTGTAAASGTIHMGGSGGAGGASSGGGTGGGVAGGAASNPAGNGTLRTIGQVLLPIPITASLSRYSGGVGGSGGTAAASSTGGGGGGGGYIVCLVVYNLIINGTVQALGGNGGNASGAGTGAGGGGGGGGGVVILVYFTKSGTNATLTAGTNCAGGSGGNLQGAGAAGAAGATGTLIDIPGAGS